MQNESVSPLLNSTSDAFLLIDGMQHIVQLNRRAEQLFGYKSAELIDAPFSKIAGKTLPGNPSPDTVWEIDLKTASGEMLPFDMRAIALKRPSGNLTALFLKDRRPLLKLGMLRQENKKLAEQKFLTDELCRAFFDAPYFFNSIVDRDHNILEMNAVGNKLAVDSTLDIKKILGNNVMIGIKQAGAPEEILQKRKEGFDYVFATGKPYRLYDSFYNVGFKMIVYFDNLFYPIFNKKGEVIKAGAIVRNITKEKMEQNEIVESKKRFQRMADFLPNILIETDLAYNIEYINKAGCELLGIDEEGSQNFIRSLLTFLDASDKQRFTAHFHRARSGESDLLIDYCFRVADGNSVSLLVNASPLMKNEAPVGYRVSAVAVTPLLFSILFPDNRFFERYKLTERETEILLELMKGIQTSEIEKRRHIAPNTLKSHIQNIYTKLNIQERDGIFRKVVDYYSDHPDSGYFIHTLVQELTH